MKCFIRHMACFAYRCLNIISLGYYSKWCQKEELRRQGRLMKLYGEEILIIINDICTSCKKSIWLEFGTLLGAYREKNFIRHDYDMDLGMYLDEYDETLEECFKNRGFKKKHHFIQYRGQEHFLTEVTWEYEGFHVDIFLCIRDNDNRHIFCYGKKDDVTFSQNKWEVLDYTLPDAYPLEKVYINKVICNAPAKVQECLKKYYGEGFMTPNKGSSATDKTDRVKIWDIDCAYARIVIDK